MRVNRTFLSGNFNYGVGPAGPAQDPRNPGRPTRQITLGFRDNDTGDMIDIVIAEDSGRDLAMKILDELKKPDISVETFGADALRRLGG